jgi:GTPase SAR1 family protein
MALELRGNPLVSPPVDIAEHGLARIKQWFADRRAQERRPVDRLRVCFVGFGGAGKTTLARLLTDNDPVATCAAVQGARPMREWSSAQVDAWIRAAPHNAAAAECRFLEQLANALADIEPDGEYLVEDVATWDVAAVLSNMGGTFTDAAAAAQVRRWWPRFIGRVGNHVQKGYDSTVGIDVWELELPEGNGHGVLTIEVVDFAGQMQFYTSHSLFIAMRRVPYVLVSNAAVKGSASESQVSASKSQVDEALYWLRFLRSSMLSVRRRNTEDDSVAQVLLAVTHTDTVEPTFKPDDLLHFLGQRLGALGEAASGLLRLVRSEPCVPRYDDAVKAGEARSVLIRAIEAQVSLCLLRCCAHSLLVRPPIWCSPCPRLEHDNGSCCRRLPVNLHSRSMSSP